MASGATHYRAAEMLLEVGNIKNTATGPSVTVAHIKNCIAAAAVHAQLAQVAATVASSNRSNEALEDFEAVMRDKETSDD